MAKVLMIDDNKLAKQTFEDLLGEISGNSISFVLNGKKGLEHLMKNKDTQIIICDYDMPIMNGYEFCIELNTNEKYQEISHIPIIGLGDFPKEKREYLKIWKQKPFGFTKIDKLIKKYCLK